MRRNKQAGVAYVEVLITVPLLIALFAGAIMVGRAYDGRVVAGQHARTQVWTEAMAGCPHTLSLATRAPDEVTPGLLGKLEFKRASARTEAFGRTFETVTQLACNERASANMFALPGGR